MNEETLVAACSEVKTLPDALLTLIHNSHFVNSRNYPEISAALWEMAQRVLREYDESADAKELKRLREVEAYANEMDAERDLLE